MAIFNSGNPLDPGEDLFVDCEMGLDEEIIAYIKENHTLQIRIGAEPFYLFTRAEDGTSQSQSIISWETTSSQYSAYIWTPSMGETLHPNSRSQEDTFAVFNNAQRMIRVFDKSSIAFDTEYALEIEKGSNSSDAKAVRIWFNENFIPENVTYTYRNLCSCVDNTTGYPNRECPICRGTSYPAAFTQYLTVSTKYHPANTVLVRVPMAAEERPAEQIGRVTKRLHRHWMETIPEISNYDLIMGTTGRNRGVLFEVTNKSDSRWRGIRTHQEFDTIRIDAEDVRYNLIPDIIEEYIIDNVTIASNAYVITTNSNTQYLTINSTAVIE